MKKLIILLIVFGFNMNGVFAMNNEKETTATFQPKKHKRPVHRHHRHHHRRPPLPHRPRLPSRPRH